MRERSRLSWALLGVVAIARCGGVADDGGEETQVAHLPVTCNPGLDRYPIAAPHNGGYDRAWSNFTCAPHPGGSPDNSDYGGDHHGNDLFAPRGAPVVAVRAGRVTRSGVASSISGNRVTIEDDCGWSYYFGHLTTIEPGITVGARVQAGQRIGTVGNTGATGTAPHVHFNVHRDGNYNNDVDPFPLLQAADRTACTGGTAGAPPPTTCQRRCDGDVVVGEDCGRGNCAAYGARCVSDNLGPRCVFFACPAQGEADTCWLDRRIGHCRNGALLSQGDCGAFGAGCVNDDLGARCVFFACPAQGERDTCWAGRYIGHCRNGALLSQGDCGAYGSRCVSDGLGARCAFFACRDRGEHDACWLGNHVGRCRDGALVSQSECGAGLRAECDDLGARCVLPECRATRGDSSVCAANGRIMRCRDGAPVAMEDCAAAGARCVMTSGSAARCVGATEPPPTPVDAGPVPGVDAAMPDVGFALPDGWTPLPEDASIPPADATSAADLPPVGDVPATDADPYFVPDGGMARAEVEGFEPPGYDDGEDPCAVCRPLGRCPPQCDVDGGGADGGSSAEDVVRSGCQCGVAASPARGRFGAWLLAVGVALLARRRPRSAGRARA
ncbi:MAG: peptidoglycan DD-metalloendopeptidase family protein [Polyangiales bacterium]